ncbi:Predicted kinase, aminoglycoside phosphotransferase (APT) family [Bhargavaea beijingensis]|uniref:Predicted kinase, aminoglycoside phosphotransferase (APT) family n=1 Tax=Bhargavaea beijingensis TaxID=426756 RepID=A0A1G6XKU4_9BACL|nr:phosphotransferase family protein [Bhargavaea beijingensis]SDD78829.1 Predicted kinase, aminoglycoside phosphotransferase (APT) family [Bhargavaea beijingensis]
MPIHREDIPKWITGYVPGTIHSVDSLPEGGTSEVALLTTDEGKFVLKRSKKPPYDEWLKREAEVLNHLSGTSLPVPRLIAFLEEPVCSWALMTFIEGETVRSALRRTTDPEGRRQIIKTFAEALRMIHRTPVPAVLKQDRPWIDRMLEEAEDHLRRYETDGTPELLEQLKRKRPVITEECLIHGDCTVDNVMVKDGRLTGIIDWSGGTSGDPDYDIALAVRPKPGIFSWPGDRDLFFEVYGKGISPETYRYYAEGLYEFY